MPGRVLLCAEAAACAVPSGCACGDRNQLATCAWLTRLWEMLGVCSGYPRQSQPVPARARISTWGLIPKAAASTRHLPQLQQL